MIVVPLHSFLLSPVIECPTLTDPDNGTVSVGGVIPGSNASYSCNEGFALLGTNERQCGLDGNWTLQEPTCAGALQIMFHISLQIELAAIIYCAIISFDHKSDWILIQLLHFICTAMVCPNLPDPANGMVFIISGTAVYRCTDTSTHELVGPIVRQCLSNGEWTGTDPECVGE